MPGKVNPVISEMMMQVSSHVIGNDAAITWGGANGNFELNVMMPMMAHNLLESIDLLANAATVMREKMVDGITANTERAKWLLEQNVIIITALVPLIGYDKSAEVAKKAFTEGRGVREVALEMGVLPEDELNSALDLRHMTEGGVAG
jgi:fumarate hydratase class II